MANINYIKKIEIRYWCVSLDDIKKISNIISKRIKVGQKFSARFQSGLTINETSVSKFLIFLESKTKEKEIIEEIEIYSSENNKTLEKRRVILLQLDFKYNLNWSSCRISIEDTDESLKDWVLGVHEEMNNLIKSLEIDDKYKNHYEKYTKDKLLFDPFGEIEKEITKNNTNILKIENSQVYIGNGDIVNGNKNIKTVPDSSGKHWIQTIIVGVIIIIIGFIITEGKIPQIFSKNNTMNSAEIKDYNNSVEKNNFITDNLRPLNPLETGKKISEIPNNTYFFSSPRAIVYEIQDFKKDFIEAKNVYFSNYDFEIQKIDNRYYLIGFISNEIYYNIGSLNNNNSLSGMLFPKNWGDSNHPIAIPFDKIYKINDRKINLNESEEMSIFDISFKEVKDNPYSHIK